MKSRRAFLTGAGLTAGAAFGLPGSVIAGGRRGRRNCCEPAYIEALPAACPSCGGNHSPHGSYTTQGCRCACAQSLITQANGIYYYYCPCCVLGTGQAQTIPNSTEITTLPSPCNPSNCGPPCFVLGVGVDRRLTSVPTSLDCPWTVSTTVKDPNGGTDPADNTPKLAAHNFKHGVAPILADTPNTGLTAQISNNKGSTVAVFGPTFVEYQDSDNKDRKVALYGLVWTDSVTGATFSTHLGQQVTAFPAGATVKQPDVKGDWPDKPELPYYHVLTLDFSDGFQYVVALTAGT